MKKLLLILLCLPMIGFGQEFKKSFEIGALYDYIEDYKKYADIGDSCGINTIN